VLGALVSACLSVSCPSAPRALPRTAMGGPRSIERSVERSIPYEAGPQIVRSPIQPLIEVRRPLERIEAGSPESPWPPSIATHRLAIDAQPARSLAGFRDPLHAPRGDNSSPRKRLSVGWFSWVIGTRRWRPVEMGNFPHRRRIPETSLTGWAPWESVEVERIRHLWNRMPGCRSRSVFSRDPHPGVERKRNPASSLDRSL